MLVGLWVGLILVLRWKRLEGLTPINVHWGQEFPDGSKSWAWGSYLRGSGSMAIEAPRLHKPHSTKDRLPIFLVKATLNSPARLTPKSSNISRKVSRPVVGSVGSYQTQIWPYFSL